MEVAIRILAMIGMFIFGYMLGKESKGKDGGRMTNDEINELREEIQQLTGRQSASRQTTSARWRPPGIDGRTVMKRQPEGWHPTSRVKYPKPRKGYYYNCGECYIWQFNKGDLYSYLLELRADTLCEERRLKEKYERPIHT